MPFLNFRRFRRRRVPSNTQHHPIRPVYIYPGLLRMSARRAVTLDEACPAALYAPTDQQEGNCAICLESFQKDRDIIRKLPCGHVFHSKCILCWITSADRCPLCNEAVVSRDKQRRSRSITDAAKVRRESHHLTTPSLPDVTPSTLCHLRGGMHTKYSDNHPEQNHPEQNQADKRSYSFVLHDHARYTHLISPES